MGKLSSIATVRLPEPYNINSTELPDLVDHYHAMTHSISAFILMEIRLETNKVSLLIRIICQNLDFLGDFCLQSSVKQ